MHTRIDPPPELLRLAAEQDHVVTRGQVLAHDFSVRAVDRLVSSGAWCRVVPGVYGTRPPVSTRGVLWAGVLHAGVGAGVSGVAGLWLAGVAAEPDGPHLITCPRRIRPVPPWRFLRVAREVRGTPPRVRPEEALLDAWPVLTGADTRTIVGRLLQGRATTPERLVGCLDARARVPARRELRRILAEAGAGVHSPLEEEYRRLVERAHGLPTSSLQVSTRRAGAVDAEYDEFALLVELDGKRYHDDVFRDLHRDNGHLEDGKWTLRYGWADVTGRPCDVARQVTAVLRRRGWSGTVGRCRRCP